MKTRLSIVSIAVKNLSGKVTRTVLLLLAVTVVVGTVFSATLFIISMQNALKIGTDRLGADIMVVPEQYAAEARSALLAGEPTSFYMNKSVLEQVRQIEGVKAVTPQLFIKPAALSCCYSISVLLMGFDPATDFTVTPWLEKNIKKSLTGNEMIMGGHVPVSVGDTVPFFGTTFKVVGKMEDTGMKFFDQAGFMTMDTAYEMAANSKTKAMQIITISRDEISSVLVRVVSDYTPVQVAKKIEHNIDGVRAIVSDVVLNTVKKQLRGLMNGILMISAIVWVLALLLMGFAFYMIVNERQREAGLLRAMGAKKEHIFRLIVTEAVIISTAGGICGLISGSAILVTFKGLILHSVKLPYLLPSPGILAGLTVGAVLLSMLTGLLSSLAPAIVASRMEPYEAIRKGE